MIFNGLDLADEFAGNEYGDAYFIVNNVVGRELAEVESSFMTVESRDGSHPSSTRLTNRELEVSITLKGETPEELRTRIEKLNNILYTRNKPVEIKFEDEPNRVYFGVYTGKNGVTQTDRIYQTTILLTCHDPYKYSEEEHNLPIVSGRTVENIGDEITYPTIELIAKRPTTFAMVSNANDEYMMVGRPAEVQEETVKERELIMSEYGDTLSSWNATNLGVDNRPENGGGSIIDGKFVYDGTGIIVGDYGTGKFWHGPAVTKEVTTTQDFEMEAMVRARIRKPGETYRIEVYLLDEAREVIGKMAVQNGSKNAIDFRGEARYGDFKGWSVNYPIYSKNYKQSAGHFHGMLRMKRIGSKFTFYIARVGESSGGKHYDVIEETFDDVNRLYQGKLRYIQIHIGKSGKSADPSLPRINSVRVYKHNTFTVDQTPYIVDEGDVIEIENETEAVYINGENAMRIKNFGAEFFGLHKGFNEINITPDDAFDARIKYREKYL